MAALPSGWSAVYRVVRRIPRGRVATYGGIALLAGKPRGARQVGFALAALRGTRHDVPWQRVLGARPRGMAAISILDPMGAAVQCAKLEDEGVALDERGRVDLARFGWPSRARRISSPPRAGGEAGAGRRLTPTAPAGSSRSAPRTRGSSGRRRTSRSARR